MPAKNRLVIAALLTAGLLAGCSTTKNALTEETVAFRTTDGQVVGGKATWGPPRTKTVSEDELRKAQTK